MFCAKCGTALPAGSKFCPSCGARVAAAPPVGVTPPVVRAQMSPMAGAASAKKSKVPLIVMILIAIPVLVVVLAIVAAIAIPGLLRARMSANETAATNRLRVLTSAQVMFSADCGRGGFAMTFDQLNAAAGGGADLGGAVPGYELRLTQGAGAEAGAVDCHGKPTTTRYYATAWPTTFGSTGARSFATNEASAIWQTLTDSPPSEPFGPPATPVQ